VTPASTAGLPVLFSALAELCPLHEVTAASIPIRRIVFSATVIVFILQWVELPTLS
jgi:hypothetical protein